MKSLWRCMPAVVWVLCAITALSAPVVAQQNDPPVVKRKILERVMPGYPETARSLRLHGAVKVEAVVASNGLVKDVEVKGGHPILAQAAEDAVRKWRFEPGPHETRELVEVVFEAPSD